MTLKKLQTPMLALGALLAVAGASWWYLFYVEAIKQFEDGGLEDVVKCLYSYDEGCEVVNRSIALLGDTVPYSPALFLGGLALLLVALMAKVFRGAAG